jgi:hypothetical protein
MTEMPLWEVSGTNEFADWYGALTLTTKRRWIFQSASLKKAVQASGDPMWTESRIQDSQT